jgi:hypothetical protein
VSGEQLIASVMQSAQQSYRFEWSVAFAGVPSMPTLALDGTGAADPANGRYEFSMDLAELFTSVAGAGVLTPEEQRELDALRANGTMDMVLDGTTIYVRSPLIAQEIGANTPWVSIDATDFVDAGMLGTLNQVPAPGDLVAMFQAAGDMTVAGTESVRGVPATRWAGTIDLLKLAETQLVGAGLTADDLRALTGMVDASLPGMKRIPLSLWVDGDNQLRRFEMRMEFPAGLSPGGAMTMRYDLFDFGAAAVRPAPAASEVTDLGAMLGSTRR